MEDRRLGLLEQRVGNIEDTTQRVDTKLDGIAETLQSLARIEERQFATTERLRQGAETFADHELRMRKLELSIPENLNSKLSAIEIAMPGLKESRAWVVTTVLACVAIVGTALAHILSKG